MPDLPQPLIAIAVPAIYSAIIATGVYLSNSAGAFSVAHAALAGIAAYTAALLTTSLGWPLAPAMALGALVSGAVGALVGAVTVRMNPLVGGLATLAFGQAVVILALNLELVGGARSLTGVPLLTDPWQAATILVAILVATWFFDRSRLGSQALASRDDEVAARAVGIDVVRTRIIVFALGSVVAGIGGVLRVH
jgi:branched-chain amino acid transport system permease protein